MDGVLFELLLLASPRDAVDGCYRPQSIDAIDSNSTSSGTPVQLDRLRVANITSFHHDRHAGTGVTEKEIFPGDGLESDLNRGPRPSLLVGAVALLLSEVVEGWREMESPLFDSAGGVAGTIKLVARVLRGGADGTQRTRAIARDEIIKTASGGLECVPVTHQETSSSSTSTSAKVSAPSRTEVGLASPFAVARLTSTEKGTSPPPPRARDARIRRRDHREGSASASASPHCGGRRGTSRRVGTGPGQWDCGEKLGHTCDTTEADAKGRPLVSVREDEMAPRAVILYRGVRLPFRWFRSGTAREMDEALREMLGET